MEFYLVFLVFYVHLVHIFPPNFSVRRHGIQEVSGSIPLISTKTPRTQGFSVLFFYFPNVLIDFGLWLQRLDRLYFSQF